MVTTKLFFKESDEPWEKIDDYIERQIVGYNNTIMMVNVKFKKGGVGAMHNHPHTQVTYISEGRFEVTIENETSILGKGDSFFVPPNQNHGVVCLDDGTLVDVFNPKRDDFLTVD